MPWSTRLHVSPSSVAVRRMLALGGCWFLVASVAVCCQAADWPQWRGPQRDDVSQESGLLGEWPEGGPKQAWVKTDCGIGYSGPAIVDGRLYIMGARDGQELLLCLEESSGKELWAAEIGDQLQNDWGDGPRGTPTVVDGFVYALGAQGNLIKVDARSGELVWKRAMQDLGGKTPVWGYAESPLVVGDLVCCTPGGDKGAIAALDKTTGETVWQVEELTSEAHYSSLVAAEIHGKTQLVQLLVDQAVGVDPEQGDLLWSEPWAGRVAVIPTPIVRGNEVYVTSGYGVGCMLLRIGPDNQVEKAYENKDMKNHHGGVILVGDHLYGHSDPNGWLCQDWATGESVWREREALGKGAVAFAEGMLYCLSEDEGYVVLVRATPDGWEEASRFQLDPQTSLPRKRGKIWTHPVICNGKLYLRDQDQLVCYDISAATQR